MKSLFIALVTLLLVGSAFGSGEMNTDTGSGDAYCAARENGKKLQRDVAELEKEVKKVREAGSSSKEKGDY
ncbi:MAG: hypothetical protein HN509_10315 [Halobacteriovoraceae bacterium]|nr:hypothetical protein [Halobacteriovoraceae bacterium]MBT5094556.1 hypothetical protein [Halobacteriovoraceae bacterium]